MTSQSEGDEIDRPDAVPKSTAPAAPKRHWLRALVGLYVVAVTCAAIAMMFLVDRFWPATVLAFLPRWSLALSAVPLLALCLALRAWRLAGAMVVSLAVQPFVVGDYQMPSSSCGAGKPDRALHVLTQNALRRSLKDPWLADLVKNEHLDVIAIQECDVRDLAGGEVDPVKEVRSPLEGFEIEVDNTSCLLSRFPIKTVDVRGQQDIWETGRGGGAMELYEIEAPFGSFWFLNVHLGTVREGMSGFQRFGFGGIETMRENTEMRLWESNLARDWAKHAKGPLIVAGDFNLPRESQIFQDAWASFGDAFDTCGWGFGYSKETRVRGIEFGTRIDHVLFDASWACASVKLGPEIGSDHRGVIAELRMR